MLQRFLHAEHHPVRAAEAEGGSGVFDGFGGVFDLEDAAVGGEGGGGEGGCGRRRLSSKWYEGRRKGSKVHSV
eukprot:scaffold2107_cov192-Alexandrium_tamarense.AAC.50